MSGQEFLSVNHSYFYGNYELNVLEKQILMVKFQITVKMVYLEKMYINILNVVDSVLNKTSMN